MSIRKRFKRRLKYVFYVIRAIWNGRNYTSFIWWDADTAYLEWCEIEEKFPESLDPGWLCDCGHWQEDGLCCVRCTNEPPWGCECDFCENRYLDDLEWLDDWGDYPGELLT